MSAGRYSALYNKIVDVIKAANNDKDDGLLKYVKEIYLGESDKISNLSYPHLTIGIPDPSINEEWVASQSIHGGEFIVSIECVALIDDNEYPFGKGGSGGIPGILSLVEDVLNVLDLAEADILTAFPNTPNISITAGPVTRLGTVGGTTVYGVEVLARFTTRTKAGTR